METANAWLVISPLGNNVPKKGITPAEAVLLKRNHMKAIGGNPVTQIEATGEATVATDWEERVIKDAKGKDTNLTETVAIEFRPRTSLDEYNRLANKYGNKRMEEAFPGDPSGVKLPETFKDAGFEFNQQWQATEKADPLQPSKTGLKDDDLVFTVGGE